MTATDDTKGPLRAIGQLLGGVQDATESTPLLSADRDAAADVVASGIGGEASTIENSNEETNGDSSTKVKGLPRFQLMLLCYCRMMDPITFFSIFPYIGPMVQANGHMPESDVGFYSGLIESVFSISQMLILIYWSRLADRAGRKRVLTISLVGSAIGPALFGMSKTIWQMIVFRSFAGLFSGSGLIIRTMIGDQTTPENQALAYSWFAFAGNVGIFLGPLIGGALADPVSQYPSIFKGIAFFEKYPYALSGFAISAISTTASIAVILFLEDTKPRTAGKPTSQASSTGGMSMSQLLKFPGVMSALWVYSHASLLGFCFTALLPIVLFTAVKLGGIGFSAFEISIYMASQGFSQAVWLLLIFPMLQHRIGTKGVLRLCANVYPFFFPGYVAMNLLLRNGGETARVWFWIVGSITALVGPGVSMAFTGVQLSLNDASPNLESLGTLNAVAMSVVGGIRAFAPGAITSLYAIGVRNQILLGHLAWAVLLPVTLLFVVAVRCLPEKKGSEIAEEETSNS